MKKPTRPSADKTRIAILKAATVIFAKYGFYGASTSSIAKTAKTNESLIFHHFVNKKILWEAVRQDISAKFYKQYVTSYDLNSGLKSFLTAVVTAKFTFLKNNPNVYKIMHWQRFITDPKMLQTTQNEHTKLWYSMLDNLQRKGKIRDDYGIDMISLLISSTIHGAFHVQQFINKHESINKKQHEYLKMVVDCLYNTLKK